MPLTYRAMQSHFLMTNCICVGAPAGVLVIDPGVFEDEVAALGDYILTYPRVDLAYTHFDFDHIIDPPLTGEFPAVRWASSESLARDRAQIVEDWTRYDGEFYIERSHERTIPLCDHLISRPLTTLETSVGDVIAVKVPGHTVDSIAYVFPELGLAAVGDMMSEVEPPSISSDARTYSASLERLRDVLTECGVSLVIPGHGRAAASKAAWMARILADIEYVERIVACAEGLRGDTSSAALEGVAMGIAFMGRGVAPWHREVHLGNLRREVLRSV